MSQEEYADLKKYIPESDMVKMAFSSMKTDEGSTWDETIQEMITKTLDGDEESLFKLLELTYVNAHNEGWIDGIGKPAFDRA
jgi:hypothetical protein